MWPFQIADVTSVLGAKWHLNGQGVLCAATLVMGDASGNPVWLWHGSRRLEARQWEIARGHRVLAKTKSWVCLGKLESVSEFVVCLPTRNQVSVMNKSHKINEQNDKHKTLRRTLPKRPRSTICCATIGLPPPTLGYINKIIDLKELLVWQIVCKKCSQYRCATCCFKFTDI